MRARFFPKTVQHSVALPTVRPLHHDRCDADVEIITNPVLVPRGLEAKHVFENPKTDPSLGGMQRIQRANVANTAVVVVLRSTWSQIANCGFQLLS